jgi:hypothetical protein
MFTILLEIQYPLLPPHAFQPSLFPSGTDLKPIFILCPLCVFARGKDFIRSDQSVPQRHTIRTMKARPGRLDKLHDCRPAPQSQ